MNKFISCDWGTSSFRLRLIETETKSILAETISQQGIAATYTLWKNSSSERFSFYRNTLAKGIEKISSQCGCDLKNTAIVVSGMASSGIGMIELEYKKIPVKTDGSGFLMHITEPATDFKHRMIIVSGIKSSGDVMRGEETMIAGCVIKKTEEEQLFILPGTHSKHIIVKDSAITDFKTYMTGELFDLLAGKSILANSVERENLSTEIRNSGFEKGVKEGASDNLLNTIFHVRTSRLFNKLSLKENYYYLSGLLIGCELKDLLHYNYSSITLVSDEKFLMLYSSALHILDINKNIHLTNSDKALINGQSIIYELQK